MYSDLRSAFRHLMKSPGFSAVAIFTLALALGTNSAIFSIVNGLFLRPVAPQETGRMVALFTAKQAANPDYRLFSDQELDTLRASPGPFADVTGFSIGMGGIGEGEITRRAMTFFVADNFFSFSGVNPVIGRFFTPEETRAGARLPVVVVSHALWQRHGSDPHFVGSELRINGQLHTVVGVAPARFAGANLLFAPEIWLPLGMHGAAPDSFDDTPVAPNADPRRNYALNLYARLPADATLETTRSQLGVVDARLNALLPPGSEPRALQITPPSRLSISDAPSDDGAVAILGILMCAMAGIVLLIASLNLANLLLARGAMRAREIAVRLAVGATRWQVVRQLTVEGLVLAVVGGACGLVLSSWSNTVLEASFQHMLASVSISLSAQLQPDLRVLAVTFGFCVVATLVFSVGPAWRSARADLVQDLKAQTGEPAVQGRFGRFFAGRHLLVMAQLALSLVLVFSSGLFLRAAIRAGNAQLGFKPAGLAVASVDYALANTPQPEGMRHLLAALDRVRTHPGIQAAGITSLLPYGNTSQVAAVMAADTLATASTPEHSAPTVTAVRASITSGYLAGLGVTLLRGRDFSEAESRDPEAPPVAIVDEGLARRLFPDGDALGRQLRFATAPTDTTAKGMTIVGITNRHRQDLHGDDDASPRLYVPFAQSYSGTAFVCMRLKNDDSRAVLAALPELGRQLRAADPGIPLLQLVPFSDVIDKFIALWIVRLGAVMFGVFGGVALVLATVGVYGVKAYMVERRTREIGIRMALGADRQKVFALIIRQGALQTLVALLVGLGLALLVGQALAGVLYQVSPVDPFALIGAVAALTSAAMFACWLPARRATKVNPIEALRAE